jgi:agmatine deiminase
MGERRLPAEWERHEGTWLSWPNMRGDSFHGSVLDRVLPAFFEIVRALAKSETVLLNISEEAEADLVGVEVGDGVRFLPVSTNEPWCRDHGPVIVEVDGKRLATCWKFNAWGEKYAPFDLDAAAAVKMATALEIDSVQLPLVLEGGMIDTDGQGTALVARRALLDPKRNPGLTMARAEQWLREELGIENPIWLDEQVAGDDTDGHVDVYARFVSPQRIVVCHEGAARQLIAEALPGVEVFEIEPPPAMHIDGERVPAGYANFYIANQCVLLPVFNVRQDEAAIALLGDCFPGREIVTIDCRELVWGLGSIHCLTQQLPLL